MLSLPPPVPHLIYQFRTSGARGVTLARASWDFVSAFGATDVHGDLYGPKPISAPAGAIILHVGDNVAAIVNAAPIGATFYFEPGVYRGVSLTPQDGQTFIGAEGAILNGSAVLTNWTQSGNLWVIGGQTQQAQARPEVGISGFARAGYPETVFVDDKPLKPVDALSKVAPGRFYFDYSADKIYIGDNPSWS